TRFSRDWSSDVCSSDLEPPDAVKIRDLIFSFGVRSINWKSALCSESTGTIRDLDLLSRSFIKGPNVTSVSLFAMAMSLPARIAEIGRASCRERAQISGI